MYNKKYKYDVFMSYASEQRDYVHQVVECLKTKKLNCFYDKNNTGELWGKNLIESFNRLLKESQYCVIFLSKEYKEKLWCNHELNLSLNRELNDNIHNKEFILPVYCDNISFENILPGLAYVNKQDFSPEQLAEMICRKIYPNTNTNTLCLQNLFNNIKNNIKSKYSEIPNVNINSSEFYLSISLLSSKHLIYFFEIKYFGDENKQIITLYDSKIKSSNIEEIILAKIYIKNDKLYVFNYGFFDDINIEEKEIQFDKIKSSIMDHLSYYGKK